MLSNWWHWLDFFFPHAQITCLTNFPTPLTFVKALEDTTWSAFETVSFWSSAFIQRIANSVTKSFIYSTCLMWHSSSCGFCRPLSPFLKTKQNKQQQKTFWGSVSDTVLCVGYMDSFLFYFILLVLLIFYLSQRVKRSLWLHLTSEAAVLTSVFLTQ